MCKLRKSVVSKGGDKAQGFESEERDATFPAGVSSAPQIIHTRTVSMLIGESIVFWSMLTLS